MRFGYRLGRAPRKAGLVRDRRGAEMLELAIVFPVFIIFLLFLFEVAYDQFVQGILESALQYTSYQVQVGNTYNTTIGQSAPTATTAKLFIDNQLCANAIGNTLNCSSLYVQVQTFVPSAACTDFYQATNGAPPVQGKVLELGDYSDDSGGTGNGGTIAPTSGACSDNNVGFCNAGPKQNIIMNVVYVVPSFLGALLPGAGVTYNGSYVHAAVATSAFYTEDFTPTSKLSTPCA